MRTVITDTAADSSSRGHSGPNSAHGGLAFESPLCRNINSNISLDLTLVFPANSFDISIPLKMAKCKLIPFFCFLDHFVRARIFLVTVRRSVSQCNMRQPSLEGPINLLLQLRETGRGSRFLAFAGTESRGVIVYRAAMPFDANHEAEAVQQPRPLGWRGPAARTAGEVGKPSGTAAWMGAARRPAFRVGAHGSFGSEIRLVATSAGVRAL